MIYSRSSHGYHFMAESNQMELENVKMIFFNFVSFHVSQLGAELTVQVGNPLLKMNECNQTS